MAIGGYRSVNAMNLRGGYPKPSTIIAQNPNHKNSHYVRPNMVPLKYLNVKEVVD